MTANPNMMKLPATASAPAPLNSVMEKAHWGWHHLMLEVLKERQETERLKTKVSKPPRRTTDSGAGAQRPTA